MYRQFLALLLPAALAAGSVLANDETVRSLSEIEAALDPLEFAADYDGVRVSIDLTVHFDFDSATIRPESTAQLDALGNALSGDRLADYRFKLIGHTDGIGGADYNLRLSRMRAEAVRTRLVEAYGIAPERLIAEGRGYSEPKPGLPPDAAPHRRVEVQRLHRQNADEQREAPIDSNDDLGGIRRED